METIKGVGKRTPSSCSHHAYSEESFWDKTARHAEAAGYEVIEKAPWLYYAAQKPTTPAWARTVVYGALGYFILPSTCSAGRGPQRKQDRRVKHSVWRIREYMLRYYAVFDLHANRKQRFLLPGRVCRNPGQGLYFDSHPGKAFAWPDRFGLSFPAPLSHVTARGNT